MSARKTRPPLATIAVTSGEPAGIGPDICSVLLRRRPACRVVLIGDRSLFTRSLSRTDAAAAKALPEYVPGAPARRRVELLHLPLQAPCRPGRLDPRNAAYVLEMLDRAAAGCLEGEFQAIVTAPVHKGVINDAGVPFSGHTEHFAQRTGTALPVMMLVGSGMRVALATTHLPLARVSAAITPERIESVLRIMHEDLRRKFGRRDPRIMVLGVNPHAGESGHMGREEIDVISPVLERLRGKGLRLDGPVPADTAFLPERLRECDAVLAMYHDQGLPVLKYASFGHAVNVTLGLPIIRTSVDHGTALDLAGTAKGDPGSLLAAFALAEQLVATARASGRRK